MSDLDAFLAGEALDDVAFYLADAAVDDVESLEPYGERTDDGIVIVVEGDSGRSAFQRATGKDPMAFAKEAMGTEGRIHRDLAGGDCPDDDGEGDHAARIVFAFAEAENPEVGGRYAEGDVLHGYAQCSCGTAYTEKWVLD